MTRTENGKIPVNIGDDIVEKDSYTLSATSPIFSANMLTNVLIIWA